MMRKFSCHCQGKIEGGGLCPRAEQCARFNQLATRISRLCYSGYGFFVQKVIDEHCSPAQAEAMAD